MKKNTDEEMISIRNYTGMTVDEVKSKLDKSINVTVRGEGGKVIGQVPAASSKLYSSGTLVLYTEGASDGEDLTTVPNLVGKTASQVNKLLNNAGLNLNVEGSYLEGTAVVISQSVGSGEKVSRGTIVTVELRYYDDADGYR